MNREIKFRAWDIESEKWVSPPEDGEYIWEIYPDEIQILAETPTDRIVGGEHEQKDYWLPIDAILMQYTGLKDRNGKDIFEGDLLSAKWKVEVYQQDDGLWMVKHHAYPDRNKPKALKIWLQHRYKAGCPEDNELIGNIHENPELI